MSTAQILNYEVMGSGEPVVLLHGLFGDLDNLKGLGRDLSTDYQVILMDLRNHGESFHHTSMSFAEMAADVAATLDSLQFAETHLVGHSMGGKVAMEYALTYPERVRSLIPADIAPVAYDPRHRHILDALQSLPIEQITSRQQADQHLAQTIHEVGVRQFLLKNLRRDDTHFYWRLNLAALVECYPQITGGIREGQFAGPVRFIKGGNSDYLTSAHTAAVTARFSDVDIKIINGTGHWLHAEKPQVFNRLARQFIENHSRT